MSCLWPLPSLLSVRSRSPLFSKICPAPDLAAPTLVLLGGKQKKKKWSKGKQKEKGIRILQ